MQQQVGHSWASTTATYTNPRELQQMGENRRSPAESGRAMAPRGCFDTPTDLTICQAIPLCE